MNYNLPKLKLFLLQKRYSEICKLIVLIQDHLNMLVKINYLEFHDRNEVFGEIFEITKILNTKYNEYINEELDLKTEDVNTSKTNDGKKKENESSKDSKKNNLTKNITTSDNENSNTQSSQVVTESSDSIPNSEIFNIKSDDESILSDDKSFDDLDYLNKYFSNDLVNSNKLKDKNMGIFPIKNPLESYSKKINLIIQNYGLQNLNDCLYNYLGELLFDLIDSDTKKIIDELVNIVVVTGINKIKVNQNKNKDIKDVVSYFNKTNNLYLITKPTKFKENDHLESTKHLFIKIPFEENIIIKIDLLFRNDYLSISLKSSQVNLPYLYNKKNTIIEKCKLNKMNLKFIKSFMRYDCIGNIYGLTIDQYIDYLEESNNLFFKIINQSILNLMKEFLSKTSKIKDMHKIIFLLLLGDDENYDIAGILLGLLKEKKNQVKSIYNLIYENLSFYLQQKVKKSNMSIKEQVEKLKKINIDNIDYSKQLITNKNIPENVKSLALEKIEEMKSFNNEYFKQLTFVKYIINFPWPNKGEDQFFHSIKNNDKKCLEYIKNAEENLKKSSYGHEEAKKSMLQIVGKWISNPDSQGTSFGLVGPPGVGKTLLAKSVSKALNIPFAQITLG